MGKKLILPAFAILIYMAVCRILTGGLCAFKAASGIPCPGCGMTRAFICIFKGEPALALRWHPLCYLTLLLLISLAVYIIVRLRRYPRNSPFISPLFKARLPWLIILALYVCVWTVRMVTMFPSEPPMDYNINSALGRLYLLIEKVIF